MADSIIKTSKTPASPGQKRPPGPHEHWLLGSAHHIQSDPIGFNTSMMQRYGDVVSIRFLFWPTYMIFHPNDVKHVLQENHRNYNKDTYLMKFLKPLLGQGLLTYALVQDGLTAHKAAPDGKGPITIKTWLRYAERRVPELYDDIKAGKLRLVGKDPIIDPAFYSQTIQRAQTPALFDFYKQTNDPIVQVQ